MTGTTRFRQAEENHHTESTIDCFIYGQALNFAEKFAEHFLSMADHKRFTVYGTPSPELKELLDGFSASYLRPFGDLEYWP